MTGESRCPRCGGTSAAILYGSPALETLPSVGAGEVVLGGCVISEGLPTERCRRCGHEWGSLTILGADDDAGSPFDGVEEDFAESAHAPDTFDTGGGALERAGGVPRGMAADAAGVDKNHLRDWHRRSLAGDSRFDPACPSLRVTFGTLPVWLYTPDDIARIAEFQDPTTPTGGAAVDKPIVLQGWRYEWDFENDRYVTTDYLTTDEEYSYSVTRISWIGRSPSRYKLWNTKTGLTEGMFDSWGEARIKAIELASRATMPVPTAAEPDPAEAQEDGAADATPRAQPPSSG